MNADAREVAGLQQLVELDSSRYRLDEDDNLANTHEATKGGDEMG